MTTPRKKRRHQWAPPVRNVPSGSGFGFDLTNPDYAKRFAAILAEFNHLDSRMPLLLAVLLGMNDPKPAGYVWRTLRNPNIRFDVLRDLLEKSPNNIGRSDAYDEMLSEYNAVRKERNDYAHGLWFTHLKTHEVYLARQDEHGFAYLEAKPEPIDNLIDLLTRIRELSMRVIDVAGADLDRLQPPPSNLPQSDEPKPLSRSRRRKTQE